MCSQRQPLWHGRKGARQRGGSPGNNCRALQGWVVLGGFLVGGILGTHFEASSLIANSKVSRNFGHNSLEAEREHSSVWLSLVKQGLGHAGCIGKNGPRCCHASRSEHRVAAQGGQEARRPCILEEDSILSNTGWMIVFLTHAKPNSQTAEETKSG